MQAHRLTVAIAILAFLPMLPANAVSVEPIYPHVFVLRVDCADFDGTSSSLPQYGEVSMPAGPLFVTVEGECTVSDHTYRWEWDAPCPDPTMPCPGVHVENFPNRACTHSFGHVATVNCFETHSVGCPGSYGSYYVQVIGQCPSMPLVGPTPQAGFVMHAGGPVTARFIDGDGTDPTKYEDNIGHFTVTFMLRPLI